MNKKLNYKKKVIMFIFTFFCLSHPEVTACEYCLEDAAPYKNPESKAPPLQAQQRLPVQQVPCPQYNRFNYVKLGGSFTSTVENDELAPAIGIGKRMEWGGSAVDISVNYGGGEYEYQYSFPKILYLSYLDPNESISPYIGGGLSWGGVKSAHGKFEGILGEFAIGYEFQRRSPICTFVELDISYGILSTRNQGHMKEPAVMLACGVGY